MKKGLYLSAALALSAAPTAFAADDIDLGGLLGIQSDFRLLSEDLGAALSYKALAPAEPLGLTGFDIGLEVTATTIENTQIWDNASSGGSLDTLPLPKLHIHKGLPLGLDVGAFYTSVPDTNITLWGGELRYAMLEGGVAMPALAVRGTYTSLSGVNTLDFNTKGLELTLSKGFAMFTPYAGVGNVWVDSTPNVAGLKGESFTLNKMYVGANLNFGLMNLAFEGDKTGDATTYGAKLGLRF